MDDVKLLIPAEVSAMLRVDPGTIANWAKKGDLTCIRTPGGRRRYLESEILALIAGEPVLRAADAA